MRTYSTDRLALRNWTEEDAGFVLDLYSRIEVQRFIGRSPHLMVDPAEAHERLEAWRRRDDGVHGIWAVEVDETRRLAGVLLLKPIPLSAGVSDPAGETEIGWHFHPDFWGRGYAAEAASAVLQHGFAQGLERVVAVTHLQNRRSQRVCERIGMRHLGVSTRYYDTACELFAAPA
ncbi:N-acetyltransferase [Arthrobacter crusticola]|uniref:N-acetyltransferase n=1 Tax=Arthrobacter crusticola TaxID=2547960 RepID=A0A4R5U2T1_9MICC|nr:GNAT family N-acetyltransferase [Arthrobacter crusticola]TDK27883.1 N-acetyltransferase [Arthrobacter crusticola]